MFRRPTFGLVPWMLATLITGSAACGQGPANNPAEGVPTARMITISGIADTTLRNNVTRKTQQAAAEGVETLVFDLQLSGGDFATCFDLASRIIRIGGSVKRTIAFVSQDLPGHATLVALACDEIVMVEGKRMGDLGAETFAPDITETMETGYREIAKRKGRSQGLMLALLHRDWRLLEVTTPNTRRLIPEQEVDAVEKEVGRILKREVVKEQGQPLVLDVARARRLNLIKITANSRREVALAYELPENIAGQDELRDVAINPVMLRLVGPIDTRMRQMVMRRLQQARNAGHNMIFVSIESSSGNLADAYQIARDLREIKARKVGWVPERAVGPATLVLLGCDEIVAAPAARLGDIAVEGEGKSRIAEIVTALNEKSPFPTGVIRGLLDQSSEVHEVRSATNPNLRTFVSDVELADPQLKARWINPRIVKEKGTVWSLDGTRAKAVDLVQANADGEETLRSLYDLSEVPPVLKATFVDSLVDWLVSPGGTVLLIVIGLTGIYIEMQMPGTLVGGLTAAVSFTLFFWAQALSGTAGTLEIVIFLLGMLFLALELFVLPGFGVTGVAGIALVLVSLILASQSFTLPSTETQLREMLWRILTVVGAFALFIGIAASLARSFPMLPMFRRLMLPGPGEDPDAPETAAPPPMHHELIGQYGSAVTPLRPAGRVQVGDKLLDVVAQGEFVTSGAIVEVIEVTQTRIVVRMVGRG